MFLSSTPGVLRRVHEVGWVLLVHAKQVVTKHLEHATQQADVAQNVKLYIILETLTLKVREYLVGVSVVRLRAHYASELVHECLS